MRKALLVIALMGAAFVGGSLANGSGKGWVQQGLKLLPHDGPSVVDSGAAAGGAHPPEGIPEVSAGGAIPAAPVPPLSVGPVPEDASISQHPGASPSPSTNPALTEPPALAQATPPPTPPPVAAPTPSAPTPIAEPEAPPRMLDPAALGNNQAEPAEPPPAPLGNGAPPAVAGTDTAGWSDAPGSAPAAAVVPPPANQPPKSDPAVALAGGTTPPPAPGAAEAEPASGPSPSWPDLQRKMKELGVSRYWAEGEPGSPMHFRCLIPLAGERAVSQQFEAEGETLLQAADAALRRVALWRATETP